MFTQMRFLLQTHRALVNDTFHQRETMPDRLSMTVRQVLEHATIRSAQCIGLDRQINSLTPGKQADLMLLRKIDINMRAAADPVASIVLHAGVSLWSLLSARRIPIPMARRRFHSLSMSGGWTAPLGKMLLIRNRSKQTACRAMELVGKAANATIEPQPAICLLKSDRGHRVYTEIEDRFLPQGDSPRAMNGAPQRPQNARRSR